MKRRNIILLVVLVVISAALIYGYSEYNRKNPDLKRVKASFTMDATALIAAFEQDFASANNKYTDRVIAVTGTVKSVDKNDNPVVITLGDTGVMSSVQCSMDSTHAEDYRDVSEGDRVKIKGMCTGGKTEEMFGTDVILNRGVIDN